MTNGIPRNEGHNGELEKYARVFIDEAHEFDSNTVYVLVKCLRHIDTAKYAFRLTLMSATISKNDFFVYFQKEPNLMERPPSALRVPDSSLTEYFVDPASASAVEDRRETAARAFLLGPLKNALGMGFWCSSLDEKTWMPFGTS